MGPIRPIAGEDSYIKLLLKSMREIVCGWHKQAIIYLSKQSRLLRKYSQVVLRSHS